MWKGGRGSEPRWSVGSHQGWSCSHGLKWLPSGSFCGHQTQPLGQKQEKNISLQEDLSNSPNCWLQLPLEVRNQPWLELLKKTNQTNNLILKNGQSI